MSGDLVFPHPMTPAQAEAWQLYLTQTSDARERYAQALDDAKARQDQVKASAYVIADAIARQAWEQYQDAASAAWSHYLLDTQEAKRMREATLGQPYPDLVT